MPIHLHAAVQSVRYGSAAGRWLLPRVLHLLSFDNESGVVGQAVDSRANEVSAVLPDPSTHLTSIKWC